MPIQYRAIREDEQEQVIVLWAEVLGDSYEVRKNIFCNFADDSHRLARTYVAVTSDGTLCAAMSYWVRAVRDDLGAINRIGHLWGAATLPTYRNQGHATQLIHCVLDSMKREGCDWSILFARDEARPLYEREGWQGFPTTFSGGLIARDQLIQTSNFMLQPYSPFKSSQGWEPLSAIYDTYNQTRPLSLVRPPHYWSGYIEWMADDWIGHQRASYWVMRPRDAPTKIAAYALVHFYDADFAAAHFGSPPWFHISEIGVGSPEPHLSHLTEELISAIAVEALRRNIFYAHVTLPADAAISSALQRFLTQPLNVESNLGAMMARPIANTLTREKLHRIFNSPQALFWEIDRY